MTAEALAAWLLSVMLASVPPGRSKAPKEAVETAEDGRARYAEIARELAAVALDLEEKPVFGGKLGRERTAALMLAISHHESGWRRDVDLGLGASARAEGRYHCLMQVAVERGKTTPEGWSARALTDSRERCFRAALHILQRAAGSCRAQGPDAWLRIYAGGACDRGRHAAERRLGTMRSWLAQYPMR